MDQIYINSKPLDSIIEFAYTKGADIFWINNAKDELKKLRDQTNTFVEPSVKRANLLLNKSMEKPAAFAKINDRGDLYDLRLQNNPYNDQTKVIPLYRISRD